MRRQTSEIEISMFPFLSVLCAAIGILMLMIIVIIGTRVIQTQPTQGSTAGGLDQLQNSNLAGLDEVQRQNLQSRIRELEDKLARRRAEYRQISQMHTRLKDLLDRKELQERLTVRHLGTSLDKKDLVHVVPDKRENFDLQPIYIEVRPAAFVVHPEKQSFPPEQLQQSDSALQRHLRTVSLKRDTHYLVFLVRPAGVRAFKKMREYLRKTYRGAIRIGLEPIPDNWEITQPE